MKKYLIPCALLLMHNEILSLIALCIMSAMCLYDLFSEMEEGKYR